MAIFVRDTASDVIGRAHEIRPPGTEMLDQTDHPRTGGHIGSDTSAARMSITGVGTFHSLEPAQPQDPDGVPASMVSSQNHRPYKPQTQRLRLSLGNVLSH